MCPALSFDPRGPVVYGSGDHGAPDSSRAPEEARMIQFGEVTITPVVEIGRSSFPTASMLPDSSAEAVAELLTRGASLG